MHGLLLLAFLAAPRLAVDTGSTVDVRRGMRLDIQGHTGEVTVKTWNRSAVRIESERDEGPDVEVRGTTVHVNAGPGFRRKSTDVTVNVPVWLDVSINTIEGDVTVDGLQASLAVETVQGNVHVTGGNGVVSLHSVEGEVVVSGAKGKIDLNSVNGTIHATGIEGSVAAETVNDDVTLVDVRADDVLATSVNGNIEFTGTMAPAGRYRFSTHNGDCTLNLPANVSASLTVSTFQGDFESDFPITLSEKRGKRFSATLGGGGAKLDVESFQGTIHLVKQTGRSAR